MTLNSEPLFSDIPPIRRHFIYGANCYQFAIGFDPITIFTDLKTPNIIHYQTLCPGNMAQSAWEKSGCLFLPTLPPYIVKQLVLDGCKEDGLVVIQNATPTSSIPIPENHTLVALYYSDTRNDFHFLKWDEKKKIWNHKTPLSNIETCNELPQSLWGDYLFQNLLLAPNNILPKGQSVGQRISLDQDTTLNLVINPNNVVAGTITLENQGNNLFSRYTRRTLANVPMPQLI